MAEGANRGSMMEKSLLRNDLHVSLVGSRGSLGKAVKTSLEERKFPVSTIKLLDSEEYEGVISEYAGEAHLLSPVQEDSFVHSDVVFLCCDYDEGNRYYSLPRKKKSLLIDFSMGSSKEGVAPVINLDINKGDIAAQRGVISAPHAISIILTNILHPLDLAFGVEWVSVTVFQPVSDYGDEGIEELHQQTVNLLNFTEIPKNVFGRQIAFNVIPACIVGRRKGERNVDACIAKEVATILGWSSSRLSLRIFLAPIFHCHSFSIHMTFKKKPDADDVLNKLKELSLIRFLPKNMSGMTPVESAGKEDIYISGLSGDGLASSGFWLWLVSDNLLSHAALNGVKIAEAVIRGKKVH